LMGAAASATGALAPGAENIEPRPQPPRRFGLRELAPQLLRAVLKENVDEVHHFRDHHHFAPIAGLNAAVGLSYIHAAYLLPGGGLKAKAKNGYSMGIAITEFYQAVPTRPPGTGPELATGAEYSEALFEGDHAKAIKFGNPWALQAPAKLACDLNGIAVHGGTIGSISEPDMTGRGVLSYFSTARPLPAADLFRCIFSDYCPESKELQAKYREIFSREVVSPLVWLSCLDYTSNEDALNGQAAAVALMTSTTKITLHPIDGSGSAPKVVDLTRAYAGAASRAPKFDPNGRLEGRSIWVSPLVCAVLARNEGMARTLLEHGADPSLRAIGLHAPAATNLVQCIQRALLGDVAEPQEALIGEGKAIHDNKPWAWIARQGRRDVAGMLARRPRVWWGEGPEWETRLRACAEACGVRMFLGSALEAADAGEGGGDWLRALVEEVGKSATGM